jgi:hypothetical protein
MQTYLLNCLVNHHLKIMSEMHINGASQLGVGFPYYMQVCGEPTRRMELSCAFLLPKI